MKKRITEEMRAAAAARRERFKGFCRRVADMSDEERAGLLSQVGAVMSCDGRALSETNSALLLLQREGVSIVGGFRQWKKAGRFVRKGEKGCCIWIPRGSRSDVPALAGSELSRGELVEAGAGSETAGARRRFLLGTVFDISQTCERGEGDGDGGADEGDGDGSGPESAPVAVAAAPVASAERSPVARHDEGGGSLVAPAAPAGSVVVLRPELAPVAVLPPAEVKTIWNSDGRSGPVLICAPPRALPDVEAAPVRAAGAGVPAPSPAGLELPPLPPGPGERADSCLWGFQASYGADWLKLGRDVSAREIAAREAEGWVCWVGSCGAPTGKFVPVAFAAAITSPPGVAAPAPGSSSQLSLF